MHHVPFNTKDVCETSNDWKELVDLAKADGAVITLRGRASSNHPDNPKEWRTAWVRSGCGSGDGSGGGSGGGLSIC